jgi:uncharacterized protein
VNARVIVRSLVEARLSLLEHVSSLYCFRPLLNADELRAWMREKGFPTPVPDMHATIIYSRSPVSWKATPPVLNCLRVNGGERSIKQFGEGATVLTFTSSQLQDRWQQFMDAGASFDYDQYKPHVTLTYESILPHELPSEPFLGDLYFGPEVYQELEPK